MKITGLVIIIETSIEIKTKFVTLSAMVHHAYPAIPTVELTRFALWETGAVAFVKYM